LETIEKDVGNSPDELAVCVEARTGDPFRVLVSTLLSLRARDEVTHIVTRSLLAEAPDPKTLADLSQEKVVHLIRQTSFRNTKALHLRGIAKDLIEKHDGTVPETMGELLALKGIGRKSANLILNLGFGKGGVCVDTHVFSLSNRLGIVRARTPAEAEKNLQKKLPPGWWIKVNGIFIAFGRKTCTPFLPKCSKCPVHDKCPQIGINKHR
jgi:endonuclease-3